MASVPKNVLRNSTNHSLRTVYANLRGTGKDVKDDSKTLAHTLESGDEGPQSLEAQGQDQTPIAPRSILELLVHAKLRAMMRQMYQKEVKRIYTSEVRALMPHVSEETLSDAIKICFEFANGGLKKASIQFAEQISIKMAQNGALDETFNHSIEC